MKSSLLASLQKAFRLAVYSNKKNTPSANEIEDILREKNTSRREFLVQTRLIIGASIVNTAFTTRIFTKKQTTKGTPRITILGGGVAGLNAAYTLKKKGITAQIYEASNRVGGRMLTARNVFGNGITTEIGGEFIDSGHSEMLALANELNLEVIDTSLDTLEKQLFFINNQKYSLSEVIEEFKIIAPKIIADQNKIDENITNNAAKLFDKMPLKQYLQSLNASKWLTTLLDTAYVAEFGQATEEQSTLNFLTLIGTDTNKGSFEVFGESDERYKIKGGNDLVTKALAERVDGQIQFDKQVVAIKQTQAVFNITFKDGQTIKADFVIIALPFTILRNIDLKINGLTPEKIKCINEYGYGDNSKLVLGFNQKIWRQMGYQGYMFNELVNDGWDSSQMQTGDGASYTVYTGGKAARDTAINFNNKQIEIDKYLPIVERAFGNQTGQFNGKSTIAAWPTNPYVLASYGCFKPGQYIKYGELAGKPIDNAYFAGEHCSVGFQGFMEGGAETGKKAAEAILKKLK